MREVTIRDTEIRLGQLLKLANLISSGSDAKLILSMGEVRVNGNVETRRGRTIRLGDEVQLGNDLIRVTQRTNLDN